MGVYIDYLFRAECPEDELVERLRRIRSKVKKLPFKRVGIVRHVDPVYASLPLKLIQEKGFKLPEAVAERLEGKFGTVHNEYANILANGTLFMEPKKLAHRFYKPAMDFLKSTTLWREKDVPKKVFVPYCLTYYRGAFLMEYANVMLRHGYLILIDPGEGCESLEIGLSTFRNAESPLWLGASFTKTQYADEFVQAHESICEALDIVKEEGLLFSADDTCKYFQNRDWAESAPIVNKETTFAHLVGSLLDAGAQAARAAGIRIEDMSDPATKNYNIVRVDDTNKAKVMKKKKS